jgi:myosin heavy subunit
MDRCLLKISGVEGNYVMVTCLKKNKNLRLARTDLIKMAVSKWERKELDNLTELAELTEETLLSSIRKRYDDGIVYTDLGDILVSVNPFREMPIYTEEWSRAYNRPDVAEMPPHIFRSASRAFAAMFDCKKDQVFVISGESGAGKTESAKLLMKQVCLHHSSVTGSTLTPCGILCIGSYCVHYL